MPSTSFARGLLLCPLLAACADAPLTPDGVPAPPPGGARAELTCTFSVRTGEMRCGEPAALPGARPVILGGQGVYVRLANTGTLYDSVAGTFETDVTVENLTAQPLGTADGVRVDGVRVFFSSGPVATAGSGAVEVANADGKATFLTVAQPFFAYPEVVEPRAVSSARRWAFRVDPGVEAFAFGVYVAAEIPGPGAVLRWLERLSCPDCLEGSLASAGGVVFWAANPPGHQPTWFRRSDDGGATWTGGQLVPDHESVACPPGLTISNRQMTGLWAYDASVVYATEWQAYTDCSAGHTPDKVKVVRSDAVIRSTDGGRSWTRLPGAGGLESEKMFVYGLWGSSPDDLFVVGIDTETWGGKLLHSRDGFATYSVHRFPVALVAVWGSGSGDVVAVGRGESGIIVRSSDGGATWRQTVFAGARFWDVWGTGDGPLWVVGAPTGAGGLILYSPDNGASWRESIVPFPAMAVWGTAAHNVYAVGGGPILHFNGEAWWSMEGVDWVHRYGVTGTAWDNVVVAGEVLLQGIR